MPQIDDKSINMVLCDLPYGITACKWDKLIPLDKLWEQYKRIIKDNGAIVLTASQPFTSKLVMSNLGWFKYEWIWDKKRPTGMALVKRQPMRQHESILLFYKNQCTYNRQFTKKDIKNQRPNRVKNSIIKPFSISQNWNIKPKYAEDFDDTRKNPTSIICIASDNNFSKIRLHSTQKPIKLFKYLIKTYTNEGDLVLDNCIGSGTTAVACMQTNRNFIGIELEPKYCDIANKRIEDFTKQLTLI